MENILSDISVDSPWGKNLKDDDSFLFIEQEIDKMYSVSAEESTNWDDVKNNCKDFLSNKSKDLKIAVWWVFANWHLKNWIGLKETLTIFNELLEKYNDNMFPSSLKAKKNTIFWLEEILTREIVDQKLFLTELSNNLEIVELLQKTQNILMEFLNTEDKYFTKILRYVITISEQNTNSQIIEEKKTIPTVNTQKQSQDNKTDEIQKELTSISHNDDAVKVFNDFKKIATMLSEYYREKNSFDIKSIKIVRFLSWINIEGLPLSKDGITQINPPSEMTLHKIDETIKNKENEDALKLIEKTLQRSPYWLDGHYMSYEILKNLHKTQESLEVKYALICFIHSNEGIMDLHFKNAVPFVSSKTKIFVDSFLETSESINIPIKKCDTNKEDFFITIKEMTQNHQIKEAIELLQHKYEIALNYEEKFKLRLGLAKLNILNEEFKTTSVLISSLEKDVQKYHLNEWRPDLALEVYNLYIKYFDAKYMSDDKLNNAYEQLCKLDIAQAFNLK